MPQNWKTYKLKEIVLSANTGLDAIKRAPIVEKDTGIKCLRIQDVSQDKEFDKWGFCEVSDENYKRFSLNEGEIIIARTGNTIGVNKYIDKGLCSVFNNGLIRIRFDREITYPKYIYYIFRTHSFKEYIKAIAFGTSTQPNMQIGSLLNYELELPPLHDQTSIASILSALDDKIELNLQQNLTLEEMAMALYKHWFVDFGPFQDGEFVESELGMIPKGWEVRTMQEVAKVNASSIKKEDRFTKILYVDIASVKVGFVDELTEMAIEDAPSRAKRKIKDGDIVISSVRPNRRSRFLALGLPKNTIVSTGFSVITPIVLSYSYLYPLICTDEFVDYLMSRSTGAAYPAVTGKVFEAAEIVVPAKEDIDKYDSSTKCLFEQISANSIENQTLTNLRDTLLPKLISGEVRVKDVEAQIKEVL